MGVGYCERSWIVRKRICAADWVEDSQHVEEDTTGSCIEMIIGTPLQDMALIVILDVVSEVWLRAYLQV